MKTITFVKITNSFHLSHLYEHIFYSHISTALREKGFFPITDYSIDARTYKHGVIFFEIEVYNPQLSPDLPDIIHELPLSLEQHVVELGIRQVEAEKERSYNRPMLKVLSPQLDNIQQLPWIDLDNFNSTSITPKKTNDTDFYPLQAKLQTQTISIRLVDGSEATGLKPLYRLLAGLIVNVIAEDMSDAYGSFVTTTPYLVDAHDTIYCSLRMSDAIHLDQNDITSLSHEAINEMSALQAFERVTDLLNDKYEDYMLPSAINTYEDTGIIIGREGWKSIANKENIEKVLRSIKPVLELN